MTKSLALARIATAAVLAAGFGLTAGALAQDGAPAGGEMPQFEMPKAPDIAKDFTDAMKTPEATKAAEESLKKSAGAYRAAKSFSDTVTITVDMMGQKNTQAIEIARDAAGSSLTVSTMKLVSCNGKVYMTNVEVPEKFVAFTLDGTMSKTLAKELGGFELPVPSWVIEPSETTTAIDELAGKILQNPKLTAYDAAKGKILVNGDGGSSAVFTFDTKTSLLTEALVNMAPPGAPEGFIVPLTITMKPSLDALKDKIAFDETGKKQVESPDQLQAQAVEVGSEAPTFALKTTDGKDVSLAGLKGKVVVIDFWAEWCGPCKRGLPHVSEFAKWAKESGKAIEVYGINTLEQKKGDERIKGIVDFWTKQGFVMPCLVDMDDAVIRSYGFNGIPATVVIGADGKIAAIHNGIDPQNPGKIVDQLKEECEKALAPKAG